MCCGWAICQYVGISSDVLYKCTDYYDPGHESGLIWNDPEVGIEWPIEDVRLSGKDSILPNLADIRNQD